MGRPSRLWPTRTCTGAVPWANNAPSRQHPASASSTDQSMRPTAHAPEETRGQVACLFALFWQHRVTAGGTLTRAPTIVVMWPTASSDSADRYDSSSAELAVAEGQQNHVLDVYLVDGRPVELLLDGESVFPAWFKLEFKETGELSAKVKGVRLGTRFGDERNILNGTP